MDLAERKQTVELKKIKIEENNVVVPSHTLITEVDQSFEMEEVDLNFRLIKDIIFKEKLFTRVSIVALLHSLTESEVKMTSKGSIKLRKAIAMDNDNEVGITFFEETGENLVEGGTYEITHLMINVFSNEKIIKTTERTNVKFIPDCHSPITRKCDTIKFIFGKVCEFNIKNFMTKVLCSLCKSEIADEDVEDTVAVCGCCGHVCN